jgi:hypothetical protein
MRPTTKSSRQATTPLFKQAATFGAAVSALVVANAAGAEAAIVDLTPTIGSVSIPFLGPASAGSFVNLGPLGSFYQWNDTYGKTIGAFDAFGFRPAQASSVASPATIAGAGEVNFGTGATGTVFVAFTQGNYAGWLKLNLGGSGGAIHYLAAAYNDTPGGTIHVGSTSGGEAPEPATTALIALGLLALGARGVQRLRESRRASSPDTTAS